ncbi:hypothetical protein NXS19_012516 [Fusarium pseudograminearum]|nr:hypothetical protein NXS19_012516 [Fusarium pseudograminearum]
MCRTQPRRHTVDPGTIDLGPAKLPSRHCCRGSASPLGATVRTKFYRPALEIDTEFRPGVIVRPPRHRAYWYVLETPIPAHRFSTC